MITLACHTWCFPDLTVSEALGTIARLGFRAVDIGGGQGLNLTQAARQPAAAAAEIRADLALYNLTVSDFYLMLPRISVADNERREKEIEAFNTLMPFAAALGAPAITVSPGIAHNLDEDPAAFDRAAAALTIMHKSAADHGLRLSITPHVDSMTTTPDAIRRLLTAVEGLALTLDWASLIYGGAKQDEIAALIPRSRHMHVRGAARGQLQLALDKNRIDFDRLMEDSIIAQYEGALSVLMLGSAGRHKIAKLSPVVEIVALRDRLRDARAATLTKQRG